VVHGAGKLDAQRAAHGRRVRRIEGASVVARATMLDTITASQQKPGA
jgi:hypothetical protein